MMLISSEYFYQRVYLFLLLSFGCSLAFIHVNNCAIVNILNQSINMNIFYVTILGVD